MPGGNIDPIDQDATAWSRFFPSPAHDFVQQGSDHSRLTAAELQALKLCALRETFEESGLLLLEPSDLDTSSSPSPSGAHTRARGESASPHDKWAALSADEKLHWREEVHRDGRRFVDLLTSLGANAKPALNLLTHWSNWVTPTVLPRRFDTHFFIAVLPRAASPLTAVDADRPMHEALVSSDGVETTSADWLTPSEGVRRARAYSYNLARGETAAATTPGDTGDDTPIILHPPQFNLLAELAQNHRSLASLLDPARTTSPSSPSDHAPLLVRPRRIYPFTPQVSAVVDELGRKRRATVLPGDEVYQYADPADAELSAPGQRNRTYVLPPMKGQQGLVVEGCLRRGIVETLGLGWEDMAAGDVGTSAAKL
ncbi:hypothetical protein JCM8202v2_005484 [Rhodotorula sphaerocarpa]